MVRGADAMRNYAINKIFCLQYRLRRIIGKDKAKSISILLEKTLTTLFGREVYNGRE
jgi:hypothetical protein